MGGIYCGYPFRGGYCFATNDTLETSRGCRSAIIEVNRQCGGFVITSRREILAALIDIWAAGCVELGQNTPGLSADLAGSVVEFFRARLEARPDFRQNPLPFLMPLVGRNRARSSGFAQIIVRNRVLERREVQGRNEYVCDFDVSPAEEASPLFYGYSEVARYLAGLALDGLADASAAKLLAVMSLRETRMLDDSLYPGMRVGVIREDAAFEWVEESELSALSAMAELVGKRVGEVLPSFYRIPADSVAQDPRPSSQ